MTVVCDEKYFPALLSIQGVRQPHGFGGGGGFVEERSVGDRQPSQVADHGLEVQQRFEPSLGYFSLIGCVGGVPGRALDDVPLYHGGRYGIRKTHPYERSEEFVARCHASQEGERLRLCPSRWNG